MLGFADRHRYPPRMVRRPPTTVIQNSNTMTAPITDPMMPEG
jgi:hypothetical protein